MVRLRRTAVAAVVLWAVALGATARPFTVDDLLGQESLGAQAVDPSGRWLVVEQRGAYDTAARYDAFFATSQTLGRLRVVDLKHPAPARALLAHDAGPGMVLGPFSPSGTRLAVYRLRDHRWTLGVVTLATGAARWWDLTPQGAGAGRTLQWLSDRELLVIARGDRLPPFGARATWRMPARLTRLWAAAASGAGAHTVLGSGAYVSARQRAAPKRLLRIDVLSGAARSLMSGELFDLELSPDRQRVAVLAAGPDLQAKGDAPLRGAAGTETEATRLQIFDLANRATLSPCPACDVLPQFLAWSPDGRAILAFDRGSEGLWTSGQLIRVDAATGAVSHLSAGLRAQADLNPVVVHAGWLGGEPVLYARPEATPEARADWYRLTPSGPFNLTRTIPSPAKLVRAADAQSLTLLSGDRLWRVDAAGHAQDLGVAGAAPALRDSRAAAGARLSNALPAGSWMVLGTGPERRVAWLDPEGLQGRLEAPTASGDLVAASRLQRAAILRRLDAQGVETLTLVRPGAPPLPLAIINRALAETDPPRVLPVHHPGARGETLTSWLFLPKALSGPPPPLVVRPYLGSSYPAPPRDLYIEQGFLQNLRMLTGHGYAVLVPSLPNPPQGMTEPADHVADRILAIIQAAAADPALAGAFDPQRLALVGWSFGGYTVMATITQTDRFKAAVAIDGISDLSAYWAHLAAEDEVSPDEHYESNWATGGVEANQPALQVPPWLNPDRYRRNSPLFAADRITTPLLLIHGWQDPIPIAGSEAMFSALFRQGKDAMLVTYWGASHSPTAPGDVRDLYARTFRFLDEHLAATFTPAAAAPKASPAPGPANDGPRPPPTRP
jgi:dipeptidyl aminopeptidase/acylaminoacyl peptidase